MQELVISFFVLSFLEIVLGIDNIVFISLIANKVKENLRNKVRLFGLLLSLVLRLIMLFFIASLLKLTNPIFNIYSQGFSVKDIIMILGGLFLIIKGGMSIYEEVFSIHKNSSKNTNIASIGVLMAITQIIVIDFVFSLDSLITAIGLSQHYFVIAGAIVVSIIFMIIFASKIGRFIEKYPELKILAIVFIFLIGFILVLEGLSFHINKGYLYFAIGFSLFTEILNIIMKKNIDKTKDR